MLENKLEFTNAAPVSNNAAEMSKMEKQDEKTASPRRAESPSSDEALALYQREWDAAFNDNIKEREQKVKQINEMEPVKVTPTEPLSKKYAEGVSQSFKTKENQIDKRKVSLLLTLSERCYVMANSVFQA